ncbi:endolytic transglycosylase MltG [Lentisalinibacter orientalis]|uniref:endolytic transglycosylase MltG n=1 Tax=Lentisalinibacter orientalis TaxID=2992241 RepID=UPI00386AFCDF
MTRLVIAALAGMLALAVALGGTLLWARAELHRPLALEAPAVVEIPPGTPLARVAAELESRGMLRHPAVLSWYGRLSGEASRIKAGEYVLQPGLSAAEALAKFVAGDVRLYSFTIVEGWTTAEAVRALQAHEAIVATLGPYEPAALLEAVEAAEDHPEGLLFPETYHFPRGSEDVTILRRAYALMQEQLLAAWQSRRDDIPLDSPYEALILASIIEKETARDDERRRIAGVFTRRLERGMRLQTDPTVIYGLGEDWDGNIRRRDLRTDTPYNTYTRAGLPPTPIALPGRASLDAAVNPAPGEALFFVATGEPDGSHYFSVTREEHEAAVERYLERLRERRR